MTDSLMGLGGAGGAGRAGSGATDDLVKDASTATFVADVIEASKSVPIVVDFWAPWCGPCKQLGPALEKVVREAKGQVRLVKINVDENQALAAQMRIQSIPAVFAFANGQPVDGFMGALPESELRAFIQRLAGGNGAAEIEAALADAEASVAANDYGRAAQIYAAILQADRENTTAIAGLARCQIEAGEFEAARATLALVPPAKANDAAIASARAALELAEHPVDEAEIDRLARSVEADPGNHRARIDLAVALSAAGRREEAVEQLLASIRRERDWEDGAARKQLIKLFEAWGPKDPLTVSGRRQLSATLFS
jgi:putative thioredoxin